METLGIIGLLIGIVMMILLAYRGWHAVPLTLLSGIVICIFNGIDVWTGVTTWAGGLGGTFTSYILLFFLSTCFANVMDQTGTCTAIAHKFIAWFGKKHILTVLSLFVFVLCYGGVSFFVCMFAVGPIMFKLFEELNVPRPLSIIPLAIGGGAWSYAVPGSTQLSNVIPTNMGTTLMAAPIMGFAAVGIGLVVSLVIAEHIFKMQMAQVESGKITGWDGTNELSADERANLPSAVCSFLPMIVLIAIIVICSLTKIITNGTMLACLAMLIALILCFVLNIKFIPGNKLETLKQIMAKGASGAAGSALTLGAVVGFGAIVSSTAAFQNIVQWLLSLDMSTYWKGVISTGVISGVAGSASSGTKLTVEYLGEYFVNSGCNLDVLHRLISLASITFDSLPHCTGCFLMFSYLGLNHKNAYGYTFLFDTAITLVIVVVFTCIASLMF